MRLVHYLVSVCFYCSEKDCYTKPMVVRVFADDKPVEKSYIEELNHSTMNCGVIVYLLSNNVASTCLFCSYPKTAIV